MKRTTVELPDDLDARLRHEAARRKMTLSELTREAIEAHLGGRRRLLAAGVGRNGCADVSERIEEILRAEVGRKRSLSTLARCMPTSTPTTVITA